MYHAVMQVYQFSTLTIGVYRNVSHESYTTQTFLTIWYQLTMNTHAHELHAVYTSAYEKSLPHLS